MNKKKFVGIFLITIGVTLGLIFQCKLVYTNKFRQNSNQTELANFNNNFRIYIQRLLSEKKIHSSFNSLQFIKYNFNNDYLSKKFGKFSLPVVTHPNGLYYLEVDYLSIPEHMDSKFLLQLNLIQINSNNKVWEDSEIFNIEN